MPPHENPWPHWLDTDCASWYPTGLPTTLTHSLQACGPRAIMDLRYPIGNFDFLADACVRLCRMHEPRGKNLFHTVEGHVLCAYERMKDALRKLLIGFGTSVPDGLWQSCLLAMLLHDLGHSGAALRADARTADLFLPELGRNVSNEWASAVGADAFLAKLDVHPFVRYAVCCYILATTYGGNTLRGRAHKVPIVQPVSVLGLLIRACDITPGSMYDFERAARAQVSLHYVETPIERPPATWQDMLENLIGFWSKHAITCFNQLDNSLGLPFTGMLGWRTTVDHILLTAEALKRGHAPHERSMFADLLKEAQAPFD